MAEVSSSINDQIERMASSRVFAQAGRMLPLLEYLVCAEIDGAGPVDQRRIAKDVFGRDDFDPTYDAIVRVEIGRLRSKLREYYATDGLEDRVYLEIPRGRYQAQISSRGLLTDLNGSTYVPSQDIRHCRTRDGVLLAYSSIGEGYPLISLAHWLCHLEADLRNPFMRHYWAELSRRYRLIRYDMRGFGLSDRDVTEFDLDDLVVDLEAVVDALGLDRFALLGPSGGAAVAAAYAARHPQKVSHLVLLGGFIRGPRAIPDPVAHQYAQGMQSLIHIGWGQSDSRFRQMFVSMLVPEGSAQLYRWMDDAQIAASSAANAERYFALLCDFDLSDEVCRITAPTIVFHGETDMAVPPRDGRYAAEKIPRARFVSLPTKNHALMPNEPAWTLFLEQLARFLPSTGRADSPTA